MFNKNCQINKTKKNLSNYFVLKLPLMEYVISILLLQSFKNAPTCFAWENPKAVVKITVCPIIIALFIHGLMNLH